MDKTSTDPEKSKAQQDKQGHGVSHVADDVVVGVRKM